ncbi:restriction endonuclease [Clostridiaceae bacterium M8S5]|nr:restriction endonuclease [Clostridiaceae bacterium M8S5]
MERVLEKKVREHVKGVKLKRYYRSYNKDTSIVSEILDYILVLSVLFFITFLYSAKATKSIVASLIISLFFIALVFSLLHKLKKHQRNKEVKIINEKISLDILIKEISKKSPYELSGYMKEVLEKTGIENLEILYENGIDMIGVKDGKRTGIRIFQLDEDYKVSLKDLNSFFVSLKRHDVKNGIVLTTSYFFKEVFTVCRQIKDIVDIELIDKSKILDLYKKANSYPSDSIIQRNILEQLEDTKRETNKKRITEVSSSRKISTYIFTGLIISLMGRITPYQTYYKIAALILYSLGVLSLIAVVYRKIKLNKY